MAMKQFQHSRTFLHLHHMSDDYAENNCIIKLLLYYLFAMKRDVEKCFGVILRVSRHPLAMTENDEIVY